MYERERSGIMLIQFRFKNHKCFHDETVLDMSATQEQRHSDFLICKNGNNLLPSVAIHGANASGKTTVIDALFSMSYLVVRSFDLDNDKPLRVVPFIFNEKYEKENSEFEVFLNIDDYEYQYGFIANKEKIVEEWLYVKPFNSKTRAKEKLLFERVGNKINNNSFKEAKAYSTFLNDKTLLLSIMGRKEVEHAGKVYRWFYKTIYMHEQTTIPEFVIKLLNKDNKLKELVESFIKNIDPCLSKLVIKKNETLDQEKYELFCLHKDAINLKKEYLFPISHESTGTAKAISLLPVILNTLAAGGTLFIDELDTQFHPLLYRKIVSLFNDPKLNIKHAQLIYTTHSTYLLNSNELRRDQIYLVEKNKSGLSKLYSLSDFEKLRSDSDYQKKYLAGEFGAIPFE